MQKELTNAGPLLNERGELCEAGYARRLIKAYDRRAIKAAAHRIKEWGLLPDHERKVGRGADHRRQQLHGTAGLLAAGF